MTSPVGPIRSFVLAGLPALALLSGCAFSDITIEPPRAAPAAGRTLGRGREIALVTAFEDRRPQPDRCGMQKNGYNMDTADVNCTLPPPKWLADALARGLQDAGFVVTASPSPSPTAARVEGDVLQFFVEPKLGFFTFTPEADISVRLKVSTPSGLRAERVFYFKSEEVSFVGLEYNFQAAAELSTTQAVTTMVQAIAGLLDRYPGAAQPTTTAAPLALAGWEARR
jgi:hypothetical protein